MLACSKFRGPRLNDASPQARGSIPRQHSTAPPPRLTRTTPRQLPPAAASVSFVPVSAASLRHKDKANWTEGSWGKVAPPRTLFSARIQPPSASQSLPDFTLSLLHSSTVLHSHNSTVHSKKKTFSAMAETATAVEAKSGPTEKAADVDAAQVVGQLRKAFRTGVTRDLRWRQDQLEKLSRGIGAMEQEIYKAIFEDLGRSEFDTYAEVFPVQQSAQHAVKNIHKWTQATKVPTNFLNIPAKCEVAPEPFGVALIVVPWNFPFTLALEPLIGAIAAGNAVLIKPSELAPRCADVMQTLVETYLDTSAIKVVQGGPEVAVALLREKWDKIFFTGGTEIGRKVAMAAAFHLTPVTLELGGKNPCYLDDTCDLKAVCRRITWGFCLNAGQVCLKPEYILVQERSAGKLVEALRKTLLEMFGEDPSTANDFSRIINDRHLARLQGLLEDPRVAERVVIGGKSDRETRYFAPTLLRDVPWDCQVMQEETFGPILAIQTVASLEDAISIINDRPKPLVLHVFSQDQQVIDKLKAETSSGSFVVNEAITQVLNPHLPFGGVGNSGMGSYHAKLSFDCFSHNKAVMVKSTFGDIAARYPPSTPFKKSIMKALYTFDIFGIVMLLLGLKK